MNDLQKQILDGIQRDFPVTARPFADVAGQFGSNEAEIMAQIRELMAEGCIRRIGAVFNADHLGYVSTLVAARVPADRLDEFIADVNRLPGVSHNYGRNHTYNVWFTLTMAGKDRIDNCLQQLRQKHRINEIYSLPAVRLFKIQVNFKFESNTDDDDNQRNLSASNQTTATPGHDNILFEYQIELIRELQKPFPLVPRPFKEIGDKVNYDEEAILKQINEWKTTGLIRRFGALVAHHRAGFTANGMVVFEVEDENIVEAGNVLAGYSQVSHCYQRPTAPDWPYTLFAMAHARSQDELNRIVEKMVQQINPKSYNVLLTTAEYKKTSVPYFMEDDG
ncbi:MAG: hypothetical protein JW860_10805 [Sedimentisphaerales bacterium]|nr:hypothetical protein [Sedimentisphaerales bacterium]